MSQGNIPDDELGDMAKQLQKFKPKKKKMVVPKELLDGANSYEDKLAVVKTVSEREKRRVVQIIKELLK